MFVNNFQLNKFYYYYGLWKILYQLIRELIIIMISIYIYIKMDYGRISKTGCSQVFIEMCVIKSFNKYCQVFSIRYFIKTPLFSICLQKIFNFFGHVTRKEENNLEQLMVTRKLTAKDQEKEVQWWTEQMRAALDVNLSVAFHSAKERNEWRATVSRRSFRIWGITTFNNDNEARRKWIINSKITLSTCLSFTLLQLTTEPIQIKFTIEIL